ncbi:MAG: RluA family pseudouridine synthase [Chthoniobacteraceae bacterium]
MSGSRFEFVTGACDAGARLDHFLAAHVSDLSRSRIQALMEEGHVIVNGEPKLRSCKLRGGEQIVLIVPPVIASENLPEDIALEILHEDEDLIVINKPPGLVVHPAPGHAGGTLVNALLHHCTSLSGIGGVERPGIVHRLDKETSGCLVAAKNDAAHQSLTEQFAGREVRKIYLAIASGIVKKKKGTINVPLGRHPVHRQKMGVLERGGGREAVTDWLVLAALQRGTLVQCTLHTGRTHQIRVHMKHLGHPLLGDEVYGKRGAFSRQMLHAWKLGFAHPRTGNPLDFTAAIPPDFIAAGVPADLR